MFSGRVEGAGVTATTAAEVPQKMAGGDRHVVGKAADGAEPKTT